MGQRLYKGLNVPRGTLVKYIQQQTRPQGVIVKETKTYTQYKSVNAWRTKNLLAQVNTYERLGWKTTSFSGWTLFKRSAMLARTREVEVG